MKQETYTIEKNVLIDTGILPNNISTDNNNIHNIDPLIEPLIDTDELKETIDNDQTLTPFGKKCASILTLNSPKQNETTTTTCSQIINRCTGIFYAIIGSCLFTCSGFIIKQLRVDFFDALLVRFVLQTFILTIFILYKKNKFINGSTNLIILQIIRAVIASSGLLLFYTSYRYIPLPDLTTCRYTQVVWTAILAMIIFRDRISIATIFAIMFTLSGVVFVAQPTFLFPKHQILSNTTNNTDLESNKSNRLLGLSLALGCALSISLSIVLNKKLLVLKIPQSILMLQFALLNLCVLTVYHIYNRFILHKYANQTMFTWQFFVAASVALIQVFSSTITQKALKLEHPSIISVAQSSDILFAIALQNIFTKEKSNWYVLFGSFLVTTSLFLIGINKFWQDQKKLSEKKKTNTKL
jgi:drug/metabolite transporter (DMT)-like permease